MKVGDLMNIQIPHFTQLEDQFDLHFIDGDYRSAIEIAEQLLTNALDSNDTKMTMYTYLHLASCHYLIGEIENAFQYVLKYKCLCENYGTIRERYYLYYVSAYIYEYEGVYGKAKEALEQCIEIAQQEQMYRELCMSWNFYNHTLLMLGDMKNAEKHARETLQLAITHQPADDLLYCQCVYILASAQIELSLFAEALDNISKLNQYAIVQLNNNEYSHFMYLIATYELRTGDLQQAITYFHKSEEIALTLNNHLMLKNIAQHLVNIYESLEDYKMALHWMKRYTNICEEMHTIRMASKITELDLRYSFEVIERRANIDSLSGVYNRYYLETTTTQWLQNARKKDDFICCIAFDVDNFKEINDNFGHLFGDEVIKSIGHVCRTTIHNGESIIARYGGDEFVLMLKNYGREQIMPTAQKLFNALTSEVITLDGVSQQIKISMGIVCNNSVPAKRFTQLFKVADQALYMAKKQGKNQIVCLSNTNDTF